MAGNKKDSLMSEESLYISMYDVHADLVHKSISKAWHVLQKDAKYGSLFSRPPKFVYRNGKCIENYLVKSDNKERKKHLLSTANENGVLVVRG